MSRWTRQELLLALGLYFETPFGKQHKSHPPIVDLAASIGRTPSAVAMKLNNFTSIDPSEIERGIKGLTGASKLDRDLWEEFASDREQMIDELEETREKLTPDPPINKEINPPTGPTTGSTWTRYRRHQNFFRRVVLRSYGSRCCLTGLPVPELLRASHIVPWSKSTEQRLNPRNGLCLSATFDAAFDRGLISIDSNYRLLLSERIRKLSVSDEIQDCFLARDRVTMVLPEKNLPDQELLQWHRTNLFLGF